MRVGTLTGDRAGGEAVARSRVGGEVVRAVNGLTARWARTTRDGTVFSAPGVWPLLGFLADGATGPARTELSEALGVPADQAAGAARQLLRALAAFPGVGTAVGLWTERTLELVPRWEAGLPAEAHGVLSADVEADRRALDAWAAERTGGLIGRMPVSLTGETELVLAGALTMRTRWLRPFEEVALETAYAPWGGVERLGLWRRGAVLDRVGVADTPDGWVTELKVLGSDALDVHLLLGEEGMAPGRVLGAGVDLLHRPRTVVPGSRLPYGEVGPGLRVVRERSARHAPPSLDVLTAAYDVRAHHDLLARHELFGLTTARDTGQGRFPGISARPLAVGAAAQSALARFGALGFRAAAVTMFGAVGAGLPPALRYVTTRINAAFDRPFGFLALHRHSRLVLAAGWVTDPLPFPQYADDAQPNDEYVNDTWENDE
ncbi:proteinase inhibitor I4 serpin [Streptomyces yokosukanensis]|uniref:Proteinase inhibitor I4 serpin n=1 Tax=Streptomyces yokosukanensis TaxID=67386 RepID=A0A101PBT8_9ACTN|nr:serpin family protein [Streptomyces yokosukanensis]KUN08618.1 proteinase inhibitor I4 serpin [Streptomyces yokosukanensis]